MQRADCACMPTNSSVGFPNRSSYKKGRPMSFEKAFQLGREAAGFTAAFPRRVFGSADLSEADRTSDRAGAAQE